jgi:hypothetical protein
MAEAKRPLKTPYANDTNTVIYAFGFSSANAAVSHEATKPKRPGGSPYHGDAYAAGGCISGTASCAFSVVPDGTGFWFEIQFPGLRPGLLSVVPAGLVSGLRSSSQDYRPGTPGTSVPGVLSYEASPEKPALSLSKGDGTSRETEFCAASSSSLGFSDPPQPRICSNSELANATTLYPQSTYKTSPVTPDESSDAKNNAALPTSAGSTFR